MTTIETTAGPIDAGALGRTLCHEHLLTASEPIRMQYPHLVRPRARARARASSRCAPRWATACSTIVDPACMDLAPRRAARHARRRRDRHPARDGDRHLRPALHVHPPALPDARRGLPGRRLRARHRGRHPGHAREGGVPQDRRRRAGHHARRREGPPRRGARVEPHGAADHGPLAARRAAPASTRCGSSSRRAFPPIEGDDRPHRRHRRPRLHRGAARARAVHRHGPLRHRDLPARRGPQHDASRRSASAATPTAWCSARTPARRSTGSPRR